MKKLTKTISLLLSCAFIVACGHAADTDVLQAPSSSSDVVFTAGNAVTRSAVSDDGCSVSWETGDRAALWALDASGSLTLQAEPFKVFAINGDRAWFGATLSSAMPEGSYTYIATYPLPLSHEGTSVRFNLPSAQDGRASGGSDIMISSAVNGPALASLPDPEDHSGMSMSFRHLVHLLRLYLPQGADMFGGESIERIVLSMPRNVAGIISADITDPSSATLSNGESRIVLDLAEPIHESSDVREYAMACIFPTAFQDGDVMTAKIYTRTKVGVTAPVDMRSRDMAAGHATSVALVPQAVSNFCRIDFRVDSNNLGEDVQTLTLTAPEGCRWSDSGTNVYTYHKDGGFTAGETFTLEYENESSYRTLSGKTVTATYDSEHVTISETLTMPDMTSGYGVSMSLNVPYLLYEDFSGVTSFSSNDKYATSAAGEKNATHFLDGWTGARVGGSAGLCVRLACRRETSADYDARMDSAPLRGVIKSPVNISVSFDYGADNQYGGIAIITDGNVGQTCHIGYVTSSTAYSSKSTTGTFESENSFYVKEYTGTYTDTPNDYTAVLHAVPAGDLHRITWRTVVEHQAGTTNTTAWLYLDNVRVSIAK